MNRRVLGAGLLALVALAAADAQQRDPLQTAAEIDRQIDKGLEAANVPASPPATDGEFLRRVTLDVTGRIPTYEETLDFLSSDNPQRRNRTIDRLLESPAYGQHFATIWNELIVPRDKGSTKTVRDPFTPWLAEQFNRGRGWDAIVRDLLTAEGKIRDNPQTGYIAANCENFDPQPNLLADSTSRLFLGIQLRCAECHDHPFAPWKQGEFWGLAAYFSRLRRGYLEGKNPAGWTFTESPPEDETNRQFSTSNSAPGVAGAALVVPETGGKLARQVVKARFIGAAESADLGEQPFRPQFAELVTSRENRWFAANAANRLWAKFFGRGLVEPLDSFSADNSPQSNELLVLLARELADSGFDHKHLVRVIVSTRAYQRTSRSLPENKDDRERHSHMAVKPLRPEMLYDSLSILLYPPQGKSGSKPQPTAQVQPLPDNPRDEFVRLFAMRPDDTVGSEVNTGLPQFLKLLNGDPLSRQTPGLALLLKDEASAEEAIESIYLAALCRLPTDEERRLMLEFVAAEGNSREALGGVLWTLVNSGEFVLNH